MPWEVKIACLIIGVFIGMTVSVVFITIWLEGRMKDVHQETDSEEDDECSI